MFGEKNSLLRVYVGVAKPEAHATKGNQPLITGFPLLKGVGYNKQTNTQQATSNNNNSNNNNPPFPFSKISFKTTTEWVPRFLFIIDLLISVKRKGSLKGRCSKIFSIIHHLIAFHFTNLNLGTEVKSMYGDENGIAPKPC